MTWTKDFRRGWNELVKSQSLDKATYVVERGIAAGHSISEIERSLAASEHPIKRNMIQQYIDLYGFSRGVNALTPPSHMQLQQARRDYKADVSDDEIEEHSAETGAAPAVSKRILEMEQIAAAMRDDGLIDENGNVNIKVAASERLKELRQRDRDKAAAAKARNDQFAWGKTFVAYWHEMNLFLRFLRDTRQDEMRDSTISRKLHRFAAHFEEQADRFEIGYDKHKARKAAKGRA